ncbi:MAG: AMP-binding protein [Hydrogenophaga sp.]|nr:AMP-binding protein [Hydrogenophaga sp.]
MPTPFDPWYTGLVAAEVGMASFASREGLDALSARRLGALLEAAAQGSPRYRRLLAGRDPGRTPLTDLPVARKTELMRHFSDWVSDPAISLDHLRRFIADPSNIARTYLDRYTVWESSGSSGTPAIFVQDARAMGVYDALEALRRPLLRPLQRWLDPWGMTERIAFVGATGGHFASTVSVERLRQLQPALSPRLRGLSFLQPLTALRADLEAFRPTVLATYPSAAVLLAQEYRAGRLRVNLREIWTGGEVMSAAQRAFVQECFACPVSQSYGASEFLAMAFECHRGSLHLNSDWVILEAVDAQGRHVPHGQAGSTTLLTNLANHVQPLIRYDLGDRVTFQSAPCACGSHLPVITVSGRDDDTVQLPGGQRGTPVSVVPLAVSTVLEDAGLFDFQLLQESAGELLLTTSLSGKTAQRQLDSARQKLEAFLFGQGARGVHVKCRSGVIPRSGRSGKVQRVISTPH